MEESENNQPVAAKQFDRVQAAIWRQDIESGETGNANKPLFTVSLSRSYKDASDQWRRTHSFTARDLPHMQLAVEWQARGLIVVRMD